MAFSSVSSLSQEVTVTGVIQVSFLRNPGFPSASLLWASLVMQVGCPGAQRQRLLLQCRRLWLNPWVGKVPWRKDWLLTAVLPGESHGQRSLAGCSSWGHTDLDPTEWPSSRQCCDKSRNSALAVLRGRTREVPRSGQYRALCGREAVRVSISVCSGHMWDDVK